MITLSMKITIELDGEDAAALLLAHADDGYLDAALLDLLRTHLEVERTPGRIFKATATVDTAGAPRASSDQLSWDAAARQYLADNGFSSATDLIDELLETGDTAPALDGCLVEIDGACPHGFPSWAVYLGLV